MKKHKVKSVMATCIYLFRSRFITKEDVESCYTDERVSVNDDLESLFQRIRLGKRPVRMVYTHFLPKLSEKEMVLVERRDPTYLRTFLCLRNPYVKETDMIFPESDSRYVAGISRRRTFGITIKKSKLFK